MTRLMASIGLAALILAALGIAGVTRLYPAVAGLTPVTIRGTSMEPTIPYGSLAFVAAAEGYATGDVVTYVAGSEVVTHRLVQETTGNGTGPWATRGDNNPERDPYFVGTDAIIGRVSAYLPVMGLAADVTSQPVVIAFLLVTGYALSLASRSRHDRPARPAHAAAA